MVGIIVAFIVTTFMGVVFNDSFKTTTDQNQIKNDLETQLQLWERYPSTKTSLFNRVRRAQAQFQKQPKLLPV